MRSQENEIELDAAAQELLEQKLELYYNREGARNAYYGLMHGLDLDGEESDFLETFAEKSENPDVLYKGSIELLRDEHRKKLSAMNIFIRQNAVKYPKFADFIKECRDECYNKIESVQELEDGNTYVFEKASSRLNGYDAVHAYGSHHGGARSASGLVRKYLPWESREALTREERRKKVVELTKAEIEAKPYGL